MSLFKITPLRRIVVGMARDYLRMPVEVQRVYSGDDHKRVVDVLSVLLAAYDYSVATRAELLVRRLPSLPTPVALLALPNEDSWLADVAPSLEFVLEVRFDLGSLDVDALDPIDAVDVLKELEWADFWYQWYARQLDS